MWSSLSRNTVKFLFVFWYNFEINHYICNAKQNLIHNEYGIFFYPIASIAKILPLIFLVRTILVMCRFCFGEQKRKFNGFFNLVLISFSFMPKQNGIKCKANNSNQTFTATPRKRVSYKQKFNKEKDLKNIAYYFILSNGLFDKFRAFYKSYGKGNAHSDCLSILLK